MPATVIVNFRTVVHASSNGIAMAFPDTCKTPTPAGPIPIPYPNIAQSSDTQMGSQTVKMDGNPIVLKSSCFMLSTGDEAGSAMGVVSNKIKGKAEPKMYSFDVKVDGENVFRLGDIMVQNCGSPPNTPPAAEVQPPTVVVPPVTTEEKAEKPEVTELKWGKDEACCGDEVKLEVKTKNVPDGSPLALRVARHNRKRGTIETLQVSLSGNKASHAWLSRRRPLYKSGVQLVGLQRAYKGTKETSSKLKMKTIEKAGPEIPGGLPGQRAAPQHVRRWWAAFTDFIGKPSWGWTGTGTSYGWEYCFGVEIKRGQFIISRKVNFQICPGNLVEEPQGVWTPCCPGGAHLTAAKKNAWRGEIERVWDKKFRLHRENCKRGDSCTCAPNSGCCSFLIRMKCKWGPGHGVNPVVLHAGGNGTVWGGPRWWYSNTWWEKRADVPATVRPHEFGHLFGAYDEYPEGACEASRLYANVPDSIMNGGTTVYERHFDDMVKWFESKAKSIIGPTKLMRL